MNPLTVLCSLLMLATTAAICAARYAQNRAENLERERDRLQDQVCELLYERDDATRERNHYRHLHASLLAENTTLSVDLMQTETRNSYLESLHRQRKGETAGVLITEFVVNPKRKMTMWRELL